MDLSYSAEYETYRDDLRRFLGKNWPLPDSVGDDKAKTTEFRRRATDAGYLYRHIPVEYGGSEQAPDLLKGEIIRDEFRKVSAPMEPILIGIHRIIPVLLRWGTQEQKDFFIPPTMRNEFLWSTGYSEPNAGSDLAALRTRAELVGDKWIINGQKIWSSGSHRNHYLNLLVRTEAAPRHQGISCLFVNLRQPGIEVRRIKQMTGESDFCEVFFNNAEAPAEWCIGGRGRGWEVSRTSLRYERSNAHNLNWLDVILKRMLKLAQETTRGGRPAIQDPEIRRQIARLQARIYAMRYSAYRDLSMEAAGQAFGDYLLTQKLYITDTSHMFDKLARDLLADDYMLMTPGEGEDGRKGNIKWVELSMHSLKIAIAGGSSNIQRNILGERLLGLPKDSVGVAARESASASVGEAAE